jgi:hypothetical protein
MLETQRVLLSLSEAFAKRLFAGRLALLYVTEFHRSPGAGLEAPCSLSDLLDRRASCENQADGDQRHEELPERCQRFDQTESAGHLFLESACNNVIAKPSMFKSPRRKPR